MLLTGFQATLERNAELHHTKLTTPAYVDLWIADPARCNKAFKKMNNKLNGLINLADRNPKWYFPLLTVTKSKHR